MRRELEMKKQRARPHPSPLPQGEGGHGRIAGTILHLACRRRPRVVCFKARWTTRHDRRAERRETILPLLGERAGVRAGVFLTVPNGQFHWERRGTIHLALVAFALIAPWMFSGCK